MARTILGASPLGISFFGELFEDKNSLNYLKPHEPYTFEQADALSKKGGVTISRDKLKNITVNPNSESTSTTKKPGGSEGGPAATGTPTTLPGLTGDLKLDNGLGFRTFGDKKSIFTNKESNPRTFHLFGERDDESKGVGATPSIIEFINSSKEIYYNSNYLDQNSTIPQIISTLDNLQKKISQETGAQSRKGESIKLRYADFAYLKKLGVYPANRLVIARRFDTGIGDNLATYVGEPISLIPSWRKDGENFVDITFKEQWANHEQTTFTGTDKAGSIGGLFKQYGFGEGEVNNQTKGGGNIFALPGYTEWLQYQLFKEAGITDPNNLILLPQGNPNIIRKSKRRTTFNEDGAFSGLDYSFSIKIDTEYEIKYIDGIDPTVIYFDIISNLLSFGTSDSQFQFDGRFSEKLKEKIDALSSGSYEVVMQQIGDTVGDFVQVAGRFLENIAGTLFGGEGFGGKINITEALLSSQIKKYRLHFLATINALTGAPSGIYHVTIGNPLRPIFQSGDLIPGSNGFKIILGPELGYNNLPTTIKFEGTLTNARECGLQEIYRKFSPLPIRKVEPTNSHVYAEDEELIIRSSQIQRPRTTTAESTSRPEFSRNFFNRNR
ncbi:hypothetical protein EBU71_04010 [bacterium]|nr:hypothetical protein [Candidatus Elulimicrobium humile]